MRLFSVLIFGLIVVELANVAYADIHAVLVAGSNGWENYRHQANVAHAYHVLKDHGVKPENIIVMAYDDIANNTENPFPGKIFNKPNGTDVYKDLKIDYKGDDVTSLNFIAILKGNASGIEGGNRRVLNSTKNDKVFVYSTGHGDTGFFAVVNGVIHTKVLNEVLQEMHKKGIYNELVYYLESCHSGSLFDGVLSTDLNILGITSASKDQGTIAAYCFSQSTVGVCMGDEFSVKWMEDSDANDLNNETLKTQFVNTMNGVEHSTVQKFGDENILSEFVSAFQGDQPPPSNDKSEKSRGNQQAWMTKDLPLLNLEYKIRKSKTFGESLNLQKQLNLVKIKRNYFDQHTVALIRKLIPEESSQEINRIVTEKSGSIYDLSCHDKAVQSYHQNCFNLGRNTYAMKIGGVLNKLCARGLKTDKIVDAIKEHCKEKFEGMENIE